MRRTLILGLGLALCACDKDSDDAVGDGGGTADAGVAADMAVADDTIEIVGEYTDNFDTAHLITAETWRQGPADGASLFHFDSVDNDADFAVALNDPDNMFSPGLYSRFDWTEVDGVLWFCQTAFAANTAAEAAEVPAADRRSPADDGCNTFAWSALTPL